jgi:hypothetical protein
VDVLKTLGTLSARPLPSIPFWTTHKDNENILFEKYSIRELGAVAV